MNNDESNTGQQGGAGAELEARIVAWVMGEVSAAEAAELGALVAASPDLAAFKARIEELRGLSKEAMASDRVPLRLSQGRRSVLLQTLRTPTEEIPNLVALKRQHQLNRRWMLALAACITLGLFLSATIPSFQKVRTLSKEERDGSGLKQEAELKGRSANLSVALPPMAPEADVNDLSVAQDRLDAEKAAPAPRAERRYETASSPGVAVLNNARQLAVAPDYALQVSGAPATDKPEIPGAPGAVTQDTPDTTTTTVTTTTAVASDSVEAQEPTVLSPFVVNAAEDKGTYRANSTLAGTRVRTDLKDVASAISVVTAQFLQDTQQNRSAPSLGVKAKSPFGNFDDETAPAPAPADSSTFGAASSPFEIAPSDTKGSYMADAPWDAEKKQAAFGSGSPAGANPNLGSPMILEAKVADAAGANPNRGSPPVGFDTTNREYGAHRFDPVIAAAKVAGAAEPAAGSLGEVSASREPVSTFSLHVSDVSFRLAQAALARGEAPDPASIRPEEFYNAFNYGDPAPAMAEKVSCHTEQAVDPVMQERNLLRIAMQVPSTGHAAGQPLRLTVLLDTSGSMEREDRSIAVQAAMKVLVSLLGRDDRVTLVGFARTPRVLAQQVRGDEAGPLVDLIRRTPPDGGTNLEEAIKLASEQAQRQFTAGAQNRIVLLTDGAANLGDADPAHLATLVESLRQRDIAFDACGVGTRGIDDSVLEALTRKGSGRYYVLDSPEAADAGFARQLAGAFHPAAENVKVQVRFNPSRVGSYRLIGFENHRLKTQDFHNDRVAAAALAGGEAAVALYEVEPLPQGEGDLGQVYVRFRNTASGSMVERSWSLPYVPSVPAFDKATPALQLAGASALLAEKLRGGARADAIRLGDLAPVFNTLRNHYSHDPAVQDLVAMYQQTRRLRRE